MYVYPMDITLGGETRSKSTSSPQHFSKSVTNIPLVLLGTIRLNTNLTNHKHIIHFISECSNCNTKMVGGT